MLTSVQTKTPAQAGVFCVRTHSTTAAPNLFRAGFVPPKGRYT